MALNSILNSVFTKKQKMSFWPHLPSWYVVLHEEFLLIWKFFFQKISYVEKKMHLVPSFYMVFWLKSNNRKVTYFGHILTKIRNTRFSVEYSDVTEYSDTFKIFEWVRNLMKNKSIFGIMMIWAKLKEMEDFWRVI